MLRIETEPSLSLKFPKTGAFLFHLAISENTSLTEKLTE